MTAKEPVPSQSLSFILGFHLKNSLFQDEKAI